MYKIKIVYFIISYTGGSTLEPGWSQDQPDLEKKSLLYIKFKNFMIFLPLKKCETILKIFKLNIIKLWTKFSTVN